MRSAARTRRPSRRRERPAADDGAAPSSGSPREVGGGRGPEGAAEEGGSTDVTTATGAFRPKLWVQGDWNAFFGLGTNVLLNVLVL